jgi:cold shock CspA family protein
VTTREKGFIFAQLAETAEECFVHKSTVPPELWHDLKPGDGITCKVQETSKGLRGYEVAVADAEEFRRYQTHQRTRS